MSPLPAMMDEPAQMLSSAGMSPPAPQADPGQSPIDPQDQARGAIQVLGQLRKQTTDQLKAIATQFPKQAEDAQALQKMIDQGIQKLVKAIVGTTQTPEPQAPAALR